MLKMFFTFFIALISLINVIASGPKSFIGTPMKVDFDGRSFKINGERQLFIAGSIHYPRAPRSEWASIFQQAKDHGVNLIQTYVFWDIHEPQNDQWYFPNDPNSSEDLVAFIREAAKYDLYVHLRIAGYVCAEWNYGGLPVWLHDLGVTLRTYNHVWLKELSQFMEKTLSVVQDAQLMASQGGPIIMLQIENEYGNMEDNYGLRGQAYVKWLSDYALSLPTGGIPWVMCQQGEGVGTAPDAAIVNACNGFYCDEWISKHAVDFPNQPHMWTENWPGWFQNWGEPIPHRPAVDVAYGVAKWFAKGGSYMNYYMLYGGTTFGRKVGGPLIVTSYDYDVAINEFSLPNEPKFSLLQQLHSILSQYKDVLLAGTHTSFQNVAYGCDVYRYANEQDAIAFYINSGYNTDASGDCVFDVVTDAQGSVTKLSVPAWSVSIGTGMYHSAASYNTKQSIASSHLPANTKTFTSVADFVLSDLVGSSEPFPSFSTEASNRIVSSTPLEQLSLTKDSTDYLWYSSVFPSANLFVGTTTTSTNVTVSFEAGTSSGTLFYVYWNGKMVASTFGEAGKNPVNLNSTEKVQEDNKSYYTPAQVSLTFTATKNDDVNTDENIHLDILSVSMGLKNYGPFLETIQVGIVSPNVTIATPEITMVPSSYIHTVGLRKQLTPTLQSRVCDGKEKDANNLCWFTASFATPVSILNSQDSVALALNLGTSMGKGFISVNGHMLGRYWNIIGKATASQHSCVEVGCDANTYMMYVGGYNGDRCRSDCGAPSQTYYKLPMDWLHKNGEKQNVVEIFEEIGGDVSKIQLFVVTMTQSMTIVN